MPTDRGFVRFYRSFWDNSFLRSSQPFSRREAWLYLFSNLANGIDRNGVGRGEFVVSERHLAKTWKWPRTAVTRFLKRLQEEKMLEKLGEKCVHGCVHHCVHLCGHFKVSNYTTYQTSVSTSVSSSVSRFVSISNKRKKKDISNESKNPLNPPAGDGGLFDKFWQAYPRHESKLLARKSWDRLNADDWLLDSIICWLDQAKTSKQWQDKTLIPHPSTFLNQRRWEADPPPADSNPKQQSMSKWLDTIPEG